MRLRLFVVFFLCGWQWLHASGTLILSADGLTVEDGGNGVTWLANANLSALNRFGLPLCIQGGAEPCVNASGSMSYQSAAAWVKAMNAANYLGHSNWQIPTTPQLDPSCSFTGPQNNSFGWGCTASALGSLYQALNLSAPNTAVIVPNLKAGPFSNFQPALYWSQTSLPQPMGEVGCCGTFSFNSGWQGSNITSNFLFLLPMISGRIPGSPAVSGSGLVVNPGGQTVYDPIADVTWLANANLGASNTLGLPACKAPGNPNLCVSQSGAMNFNSAQQFVKNMNAAAYLGQTNWELPTVDESCAASYLCSTMNAPFQSLFYTQLGLSPGTPVVAAPATTVGPFTGIRPYLYWTCGASAVAKPCDSAGPAPGFQWSFWFDNGFEGTDVFAHDMYVTAYFPGARTSTTGPEIAFVANAEGESPIIAPNTWVEIKGVNLAPAGDSRTWGKSDFAGNVLPTQLDKVSATVNGKSAYVYYISASQIDILTPPDSISGAVQVAVTNNGDTTAVFTAQAQATSPSFFVLDGTNVAAVHLDGSLVGPTTLYPGASTPAKPGETIAIYANGFGSTGTAVASGSLTQSGSLPVLPVVQIGGVRATVQFAGLVGPGEFQFNVVIPATASPGNLTITAAYGGLSTQAGALIAIQGR